MKRPLGYVAIWLAALGCAKDALYIHTVTYRAPNQPQARKMAVVDFAGEGGQAIADLLTLHLFRAGFQVVERDRIQDVIREAEMTLQGFKELSDLEKAQRLGRILNAEVIMTGRLLQLRRPAYMPYKSSIFSPLRFRYALGGAQIAARAIDVRTGRVVWICLVQVNASAGKGEYLKLMDYVSQPCAELVRSFKNKSYRGRDVVLYNSEIPR